MPDDRCRDPDQEPVDRTFIDISEDSRVVDAVRATGCAKLISAGLRTGIYDAGDPDPRRRPRVSR